MSGYAVLERVVIDVVRLLGMLIPPVGAWIREKARTHAAQALQAYLTGNVDMAEAGYRNALAWNPFDSAVHAQLGQVFFERGRGADAETHFRKALDNDYENLRALQGLGLLLQGRGELEEAMYFYLRYLEIQPKDAGVCLNLGVIFHTQGDYERALEYYVRAEKEAPGDTLAPKNHAIALFALGRFEDARTLLQRAGETNPADGEIDRLMAQVLQAHGDFEGAARCYEAAIEKNPGDAEAYLRLADVTVLNLGRPADAVSRAAKALELFLAARNTFGASEANWSLGWAYYKLRDWNKSVEASSESLKLNPDQAPVRFNRALALLQLGRSADARTEYVEGINRMSQETDLKFHAINDLADALKDNPNLAGGKEILAMLEERYAARSKGLNVSVQESADRTRVAENSSDASA